MIYSLFSITDLFLPLIPSHSLKLCNDVYYFRIFSVPKYKKRGEKYLVKIQFFLLSNIECLDINLCLAGPESIFTLQY